MDDKYQKDARMKLRFATPQGQLTVEDLFDLPLRSRPDRANLDDIAKSLNREIRQGEGEVPSFVEDNKPTDTTARLGFEIVLDVIGIKKAENAARLEAVQRATRKEQILGIIAGKQNEALSQKSIEELQAELAKL